MSAAVLLSGLAQLAVAADDARYPGEYWERVSSPEELGYASAKLQAARKYSETIHTAAVMVVVGGVQAIFLVNDNITLDVRRFQAFAVRSSRPA